MPRRFDAAAASPLSRSARGASSVAAAGAGASDPLISASELASQLEKGAGSKPVKVLDATWYLPAKKRDGRDDFARARVPSAQYFDIDAIADRASPLKHTLPPARAFAAAMNALGITNEDPVVIYETNGVAFAAARAWWMFKCFGHGNVRVLDGGLPAWKSAGGLPLDEAEVAREVIDAPGCAAGAAQEDGSSQPSSQGYRATLNEALVASKEDILADLSKGDARARFLLDARGEGRFKGSEPEVKPGLRSGHIPGSFSMNFNSLLQDGGLMKSKDALRESGLFQEAMARAGEGKVVTATCGSGVTACVIALALARFDTAVAVYDGSWSDWGADASCPIETGG